MVVVVVVIEMVMMVVMVVVVVLIAMTATPSFSSAAELNHLRAPEHGILQVFLPTVSQHR